MQRNNAMSRYAVGIAAAVLAVLLRVLLTPLFGEQNPYHTLWLAVIVVAWICGLGPSLLTTIIGALGVWFWVLPPVGTFNKPGEPELLGMLGFLVFSGAIIVLSEASRRAGITQSKLAAIVDSSDDAIVSKNLNGIITSWNEGAERVFGYTAAEAIGQHITLIIPPERRSEEDTIISKIRSGDRIDHFETIRKHKNGKNIIVSLTISPVKDASGLIVGASKVARDITEKRQTEQELRESQERLRKTEKIAAAGQLAASLAHEINNPLSSVTNALYLLDNNANLDRPAKDVILIARTELARMSRIVKQSLSYYRASSVPKEFDVGATVRESLQIFSDKLDRTNVALTARIAEQTPVVGFPDEIRQVIDNLLVNAMEAMPQGGQLNVSVHPSPDWKDIFRHGIRMTIADSGSGIPKELISRIFEPFFTTKLDKGTGLGLWVVQGIIAKHEGNIRVRSSYRAGSSGTVISVFLPALSDRSRWTRVERSPLAKEAC